MLRRYRSSYSKRHTKSQYFPSSSRSFRYPSYYQRIGRTIQTTPGRVPRSPMKILGQPDLERMYKTLVQYKYPIPQPPLPVPVQPFFIQMTNDESYLQIKNLFISDGSYVDLSPERFYNIISRFLRSNLPAIFNNFSQWRFQLYYIVFENLLNGETILNNIQFTIQWVNNLLTQGTPYGLIMKTLNGGVNAGYDSPVSFVSPSMPNQANVNRLLYVNNGTFGRSSASVQTNDSDITDNGFYPIIDTAASESDVNYGFLQLVSAASPTDEQWGYAGLEFSVLCTPIVN